MSLHWKSPFLTLRFPSDNYMIETIHICFITSQHLHRIAPALKLRDCCVVNKVYMFRCFTTYFIIKHNLYIYYFIKWLPMKVSKDNSCEAVFTKGTRSYIFFLYSQFHLLLSYLIYSFSGLTSLIPPSTNSLLSSLFFIVRSPNILLKIPPL